ncbi:MAG: cytochrome c family protein [Salaquimonas sp.]|jgi:cytochrome c|nr:cytochrome c family protein [Salaquimonas sp.]
MNSFPLYKIAMAVLGTIFVMFGLSIITEAIFSSEPPETPGYAIAAVEPSGGEATKAASGPAYDPIIPLLASANVEDGMKISKKCQACHNFDKGGPNKVGPNLYGVVGRPIASHEGFSYSSGMQAFGAGKTWTYKELNGFLWNPKKHVKGTAMGFAGLKKTQDRADIIAYLRTLSDNPVPLPEAGGETAGAAPATEAPPAGDTGEQPKAAE